MNKLAQEKSPYLRQHMTNPVEWYPWGGEAFLKAQKENKPIFISIGYATCHWCHVMAHESFEDADVAEILNKYFVSIKVDREERPDIDSIYMTVCQMMTGHGGWPLNAFISPDKEPFFAGTYFPKESQQGRLGFKDLLLRIHDVWTHKKEEVNVTLKNVKEALIQAKSNTISSVSGDLNVFVQKTYEELCEDFDPQNGGFGGAPKFPSAQKLQFLMCHNYFFNDVKSIPMVKKTLYEMHRGAFFDHVGGGVHRYSTDEKWELPHFEKMLYDQANTALAYTQFYQKEKDVFCKRVSEEILNFCIREFKLPNGGYASAYDADSEGEEGVFYSWKLDELRTELSKAEFDFLNRYFDLKPEGNYQDEATHQLTGRNILYLKKTISDLKEQELFFNEFSNIKVKLNAIRNKREKPLLDNKILCDWNSFLAVSFIQAGQAFKNQRYLQEGLNLLEFLEKNLSSEGLMLHRICDDEVQTQSFLDDQAYFLWALLDAYRVTYKKEYLIKAQSLLKTINDNFLDARDGTYFLTPQNQEIILTRSKDFYDGAHPSANSVLMYCQLKLAKYTRDQELEKKALAVISNLTAEHINMASAFSFFAMAVLESSQPYKEVIIRGSNENLKEDYKKIKSFIEESFLPSLYFHDTNNFEFLNIPESPSFLVYVCQGQVCAAPTTGSDIVIKMLKN